MSARRPAPTERPGLPGGVRDQNRKARTEAIEKAALGLFLARGIEPVTIDEITAAASVAKGSFYRYFAHKSDVVEALLAPASSELQAAFTRCDEALRAATGREQLTRAYVELAGSLAAIVAQRPDVVRLYLQECRAPGVGARAGVSALAELIARGALRLTESAQAHGLLRPVDPRVSASVVVGAAEKLLHLHLTGADLGDPDALAPALIAMVLTGLAA